MIRSNRLLRHTRAWTLVFIAGLVLSGVMAVPPAARAPEILCSIHKIHV